MISFWEIMLRMVVALVLGAVIGLERELREQTAGMRTNGLVALGAALFTIISAFGFLDMRNLAHVQVDPTRIASYVVAGIGFLGGGTIFFLQEKERVRGLTTAAAIWVVAAIGMACGAGLLLEATATTLLTLVTLVLLRLVEQRILVKTIAQRHTVQVEVAETTGPLLSHIYTLFQQQQVKIEELDINNRKGATGEQGAIVKITCYAEALPALVAIVGELRTLPEVQAVHTDILERKMM